MCKETDKIPVVSNIRNKNQDEKEKDWGRQVIKNHLLTISMILQLCRCGTGYGRGGGFRQLMIWTGGSVQ